MKNIPSPRALARVAPFALSITTLVALPAPAADIVLTPPAGGAVNITNAAGNTTRLRVGEDGVVTLPALATVPVPATGVCMEIATGRFGTCALASGTVTGVNASAPLASSGGAAPSISLSGTVPVGNGGTGLASLTNNGIVYGQGASAVGTAVGASGQVLVGSAGAPAWTGSPSISGNLSLVNSSSGFGHIMKGGVRFIHDYGVTSAFFGAGAGNFTLSGSSNTGLGQSTLSNLTTGSHNTATGHTALQNNTIGTFNTANGRNALSANTSGSSNVAVGVSALFNNTVANNNVAVGFNALMNTVTGGDNIALGTNAGMLYGNGSSNIAIGNQGVAAEVQTIRVGTVATHLRTFVAGIRGVTTGVADAIPVFVDSSGQLGTVSSSRRVKADIADMDDASASLMKLRPVTFHYRTHGPSQDRLQYGLIAEEVAEVYPGLVARSADGEAETVMYQYLPPMLLNEVQKHQRTIAAQADEIEALRREVAWMASALRKLTSTERQ